MNDPVIINLQSTKVYVFSDSVLCFGKVLQHPECNEAWKNRVAGVRAERSYRDYDAINGESTEFEWNIFPGFTSLQLCDKISNLLRSLGQTPETFTGRILFMTMFNDISCDRYDNKDECLKNAEFVKTFPRRFGIGQWSFIGPSSEKRWYPSENSPQGAWDHVAEEMLLKFAASGHPIFRSTTPLSRGRLKSKGKGKVSIHFIADQDTVDTIYRIILSVSQLGVYGAVAAICDEHGSHYDGTVQPVILVGQSIVLGGIKAEVPVHDEEPRNDQIILQQYVQQVESLSPERVSKFCKEAGFMRFVEVGQYFVTRDAGEFQQTVACREYTLPRDDQASEPKGWIGGNTRIGPVLEVTTSSQHFKYGIEIRIESVNKDNSHSWVRISYGTVKYVNDSIEDNTENPADSQEEESVQTSSSVVAARSKAKAKPQPREYTGTTTVPLRERKWIDVEPSKQDLESYDLSKKVVNLLRHNQKLHREEDGAIQFYKIKFHLRDHHSQIQNWSDDRWKACVAAGGGSKRRYQYCSDNLGTILYLRALQGHSGSNLIDPALQDNVLIRPGIFPYIYHVGSNFNLHSIISNGLIPGGQNLSRRQTVFFLPVDPRNESHRDPEYIDYSVPRHARYLQNTWKRHQDTVFWIDIDLGIIKEGLRFYQTRSNAIILQGALPANCIVRAERLRNGEKLHERKYLSPRPPPKISLKHDLHWSKGKDQGSTVEHRPVGKLVQQSLGETLQSGSSKPTQFPKPIEDRTGQPVTQEIVGKLQEEFSSSDRSGQPDREERLHKVQEDGHLKNRDDADKFNLAMDDENIDFNISGIPDATVKRTQSINIHDFIQRIENHPQKEAIQNDLEQHPRPIHPRQTFRKAMIEVGRSEKIIKEMDQLASENHTYKATKAEIDVYRGNWWIHSNVANFDSVPARHQPDFKKALSTMHRLKKAEDEKQYTKWSQSSSSSSWQWHANWWESDYEYSPRKWYDH